jgi:hypothetical protein
VRESVVRGFADQLIHYFDRPHVGVPEGPLGGPAAWRSDQLDETWSEQLDSQQVEEILVAVAGASRSGRPTAELSATDLPLPSFAPSFDRWRRALRSGRGFVLVSGFPVGEWSSAETETACWGIGLHLGDPGAQNVEGDLLGHVRDVGTDLAHGDERLYRTNQAIRFHCDAADVVGLLCRSSSPTGGASRLVSSVTVFNELLEADRAAAFHLFDEFALDARQPEGSATPFVRVRPAAFDGEQLRTFMHLDYFESAARHHDVELDELTRRTLRQWEAIAERPELHLGMQLAPGDLQLVSNHSVVHARTEYRDDPSAPRDLLRLWLSLDR